MDRHTQQIITALSELHAKQLADVKEQLLACSQVLSHGDIIILSDKDQRVRNATIEQFSLGIPSKLLRERFSLFKDPIGEEETLRRSVSVEILHSLKFSTINERYEGVAEAHKRTFEWVYKDSPFEDAGWSNFTHWLQHDDGLYWIQGKAGSGKSTLMKYICDNELTKEYLAEWAGSYPLYTADSFLWNIGATLQKSQAGLFRKLLYDILREVPDLIPIVLPHRWAATYSCRSALVEDLKVCIHRRLTIDCSCS